ncbi:MAG TPA: hypothetical protein VLH79_13320 [Chthonomonadales bacterium]|nr:hypothetical protein [Chthonomonadales bacterium]
MSETRSNLIPSSLALVAIFLVCSTVLGCVYLLTQPRLDSRSLSPPPAAVQLPAVTPWTAQPPSASAAAPSALAAAPSASAPDVRGGAGDDVAPGNEPPFGASALLPPRAEPAPFHGGDAESVDDQDAGARVYATRTGRRYHRDGCEHLARSRIPMSLQGARLEGLTPCRACFGSQDRW